MASQGFLIRVYGEVNEQPPYLPDATGNLPAVSATYSATASLATSFPAEDVIVYPIADPGAVMNGATSCYGVIEVPASGLNQHGKKYVVQQTVTAVNSLRNA